MFTISYSHNNCEKDKCENTSNNSTQPNFQSDLNFGFTNDKERN